MADLDSDDGEEQALQKGEKRRQEDSDEESDDDSSSEANTDASDESFDENMVRSWHIQFGLVQFSSVCRKHVHAPAGRP